MNYLSQPVVDAAHDLVVEEAFQLIQGHGAAYPLKDLIAHKLLRKLTATREIICEKERECLQSL